VSAEPSQAGAFCGKTEPSAARVRFPDRDGIHHTEFSARKRGRHRPSSRAPAASASPPRSSDAFEGTRGPAAVCGPSQTEVRGTGIRRPQAAKATAKAAKSFSYAKKALRGLRRRQHDGGQVR